MYISLDVIYARKITNGIILVGNTKKKKKNILNIFKLFSKRKIWEIRDCSIAGGSVALHLFKMRG